MSSIHYPQAESTSRSPVEIQNGMTPPSKHGVVQNGFPSDSGFRGGRHRPSETITEEKEAEEKEEEQGAKKKRASFPPISLPRDHDTNGTPPKSRHSMAEVVARMRVREKTLLGEGFLKGRETKTENGSGGGSSGAGGKLSTVNGAIPNSSVETTVRSHRESAPYTHAEWLASESEGALLNNPRTRKYGTTAFNNAWGTPRGPAVSALAIHGASNHTGSFPLNDVRYENGRVNGWHHHRDDDWHDDDDDDVEDSVDSPAEENDDVSDDDDDFDFDEGEEEVAAQREKGRQSRTTAAVYQRACDRLRIQPSPAFLRQCNLTSMDLRDVRLGPADVKPIAIALVRDMKLLILDLSNNDLGPIGVSYIAEMLQENTTLMDLNLSATNPGREGVKALVETLRHNRSLAFLRLEENRIEHTESHLLADMIRSVPNLQGLYLGHNRLGYFGGAAIASAIAQNRTMLTLDLHWNHIRRDSAAALARSLSTNTCLRSLNLAWNGLGKEGCLALAHALPKNTSLRELDLTCNRVDLMSLGFLLKGVTRNKRLNTLRIGQNPLTTEGAKALISAVMSAPDVEITEIDITGVPVDLEFTQMVARAQESRVLNVRHEEAITLATSDQTREHDGTNLDRYDPLMVLFEYMKMDNLRVIDFFQFMDTRKRDKLSKSDIREGLNTLKLPVTEHAIDVIHQKLDLNRDGFVELDEMMKVQRDTARQVKLRQIKAKSRKREDESLNGLHKILRDVITKRTEENESGRRESLSVTKTSGGRKSSVGGLQLTQARYSVTSTSKRGGESDQQRELASVRDEE